VVVETDDAIANATVAVTAKVPRRGTFELPHADRLRDLLPDCSGTECGGGGALVEFHFSAAARGRLQLTRIQWTFEEEVGD
jgi:hypothetical protein